MLSCVKCNRTDGWTLPVQSWLQAITATGVAQSIFWCLLMQTGKAIHPAPAREGWRFGSGHLVAVGGHLDLMSLDLPLLQRSFSFSQRFLPHHGAAWVRCPLQSVCGLLWLDTAEEHEQREEEGKGEAERSKLCHHKWATSIQQFYVHWNEWNNSVSSWSVFVVMQFPVVFKAQEGHQEINFCSPLSFCFRTRIL